MPSHKVLKSIVRNVAESFASSLNYYDNDYVLGHIVKMAWKTGETELRVNLLTGEVGKTSLLNKPVKASVKNYLAWFPELVVKSQSSMEFIASAELTVTTDPAKRRLYRGTSVYESPVTCTVRVMDDLGKEYSHIFSDWWYPEKQ